MEPTKEQWFWEQCGFKANIGIPSGRILNWWLPDDAILVGKLPPIDLNNLFRYAVPKSREMRFMLNLSSGMLVSNTTVTLHKTKNETYQGFSEDPAQALFQAIYKALGG